ncbi:EF-hand calcium-binding domain-containing protein 11 isoform X4 [Oryctolagus cuniculus]|uniref:EF-hand calcium-binding domain-containing protein 11 isoform X4 n=1 Tax=Oryctolagus cuniculus TaxID=9986 RepID=UPI00387A7D79
MCRQPRGAQGVFKACDEDHKGYLSREDFKVAVVMLFGYKPSKIEADSVMSSISPGTSGVLLEEFVKIIRKKKEAQLYQNERRHIFTAFDIRYRGFLTLEDFQKAFRQVAPRLPERTVLEVFSVHTSLTQLTRWKEASSPLSSSPKDLGSGPRL